MLEKVFCVLGLLAQTGYGLPQFGPPSGFDPAAFATPGFGPPGFVTNFQSRANSQGPSSARSTDSLSELLEGKVIEEHEDYNEVSYPASKWVCTKDEFSLDNDPMDDWQSRFPNGIAAMQEKKKINKAEGRKSMFKKLFRYIIGVNSESKEIEMTRPVTTKRMKVKGKPNMEMREMCFWTGTEWADKEIPLPIDKEVYIEEREPFTVFVRRFGGWALSQKDWQKEMTELKKSIKERKDVEMDSGYFTVGYNSPWTMENRRNEVWMPKKMSETSPVDTWESPDDDLETVPYKVIKTSENYELREYPAEKWVCTMLNNMDPNADPMNGWEERFDNNPIAAMASKAWMNQPSSKMFMSLFKYISGVNKDFKEIKMTTPVTTKNVPEEGKAGLVSATQCFWLGSQLQVGSVPEPIDKNVFIQDRPMMKVFVRTFGGFAMSEDDFRNEYMQLSADLLKDNAPTSDPQSYYDLSYNSPWTMKNRRNEIWIEAKA